MITCSYDMSFKNWKYIWVSWIFINFNENINILIQIKKINY